MNAKMTRREALMATAGVAAAALAPAQDNKPDSMPLRGQTVLPRSTTVRGEVSVGGSTTGGAAVLGDASYTVKLEGETRVLVIDGLHTAWVAKTDLVPLADAVAFYDAALKKEPTYNEMRNYRAWALRLLGKRDDAVKGFTEFLKTDPTSAYGLSNRGLTHAELGNFADAFVDLYAAVEGTGPGRATARANLGFVHELRGDFEKAIAEYKKAVSQDSVLAKNNLAWVYATCPTDKLRDWAEAVRLAKTICDATENMEGMYLDTLAAAYAETGKFDDAVKAQELAHKDKSYDLAYGDEGRARLELYKQKKPFRTDPPKK